MKRLLFIFLSSSLFATQAIVVDPYFSPFTGAPDLLTAHWILQEGEDHLFTDPVKTTIAKAWGRTIEQLLIWDNINRLASIIQHEVLDMDIGLGS